MLWGFYRYLDNHPTETVIVSLKVDSGSTTAQLQQTVQGYTTSSPGSSYWITDATLGTLGAARGKLILFRRFDWSGTDAFGLNMEDWADNRSFSLPYADGATAYVEDYYQLDLGSVPADTVVATKLAAVVGNLDSAVASGANSSELFVTFSSGGGQIESQYVNPRVLALGSTSTDATSTTAGVNAGLLQYLQGHSGGRLGVILMDFYDTPTDLVLAAIANNKVTPNAFVHEPEGDHRLTLYAGPLQPQPRLMSVRRRANLMARLLHARAPRFCCSAPSLRRPLCALDIGFEPYLVLIPPSTAQVIDCVAQMGRGAGDAVVVAKPAVGQRCKILPTGTIIRSIHVRTSSNRLTYRANGMPTSMSRTTSF